MRIILRWLLRGVLAIVVLVAVVLAGVYIKTSLDFSETYDVQVAALAVPDDPATVAEGERLARIRGCIGCHDDGNGGEFFSLPDGTRLIAPNLFKKADEYSVEELIGAIRHGLRPDGSSVIGIMPSRSFFHLTDADLRAILAWMQAGEPAGKPLPETRLGPILRAMMLYYQGEGFQPVAAAGIDHDGDRLPADPTDTVGYGEYLATTVCAECHGMDLKGGGDTPNLVLAKAYTEAEFIHLMKTGEPRGDNTLDLMAKVAEARFSRFTDEEIRALYAFLQARAP